jgi:hypothetical protein
VLDEKALRKPGFNDGYAITLADGQTWTIPKPRFRFRPTVGSDGRVEVGGRPTFGPEYEASIEVLYGVGDVEPIETLRVKFEMAVRLLSANYDLKPDDFSELIVLEPDDPASNERWEQLTRALMGVAPKPSPAI